MARSESSGNNASNALVLLGLLSVLCCASAAANLGQ